MSCRPLVSVITPSFNQSAFLAECLASVSEQSYPDIEHIVIDGASEDESVGVLRRHAREGLRWVSEADRGQAHAINKGLEMARGEIVCWLNSDDLYFDRLVVQAVVEAFCRHPSVDVVVGDGYLADREGKLLNPIVLDGNALNLVKMRQADLILQPSAFWRRNDLRVDEDLNYTFDWLFFLEMFERSMSVLYLRRYLSLYRWYGSNKTARETAARRGEIAGVLRQTLGPVDPSTMWCTAIFWAYRLAEATGAGWVKRLARKANAVVSAATRYRIGSG